MGSMAGAAGVCWLAAVLSVADTMTHYHSVEAETYRVSAGRLFLLRCPTAAGAPRNNVTWSRGPANSRLPVGVEVRDGVLWFLPVQASHNGSYTCERWHERSLLRINIAISVSSGMCPDPSEVKPLTQGVSKAFPCKQTEIMALNDTRKIRWLKDCEPVKREKEPLIVHEDGAMRLPAASEEDAGNYTCVVDISLNGTMYTSARSLQLALEKDMVPIVPKVLFPTTKREVVVVKVDARVELKCLAQIGYSEDRETDLYWLVNDNYPEDVEGCEESKKYVPERGRMNMGSTLTIFKAGRCFMNVPICCKINSPIGEDEGCFFLQEADNSFYTIVVPCLAASLALLFLAATFCFFKVDFVLAYRRLLMHFAKPPQDVDLYDAYVSFLHPSTMDSAKTASFAQEILPEQLEKQHGYSLFIRGRDDCPGEAVQDTIATTLRKCCKMIIILSDEAKLTKMSNSKTDEELSLCDNQSQVCYEQKLGLYDALMQNKLRVILVEIDCPVEYSRLPESLGYVKRKQGALRWKTVSSGAYQADPRKLRSNRQFWKNLRYQMPSVPVRRRQTTV